MRFRFLLSFVALFTVPSLLLGQEVAGDDASQNVIASFPISDEGVLLLPVKIGDKTYRFIVDTGATFCCFDPALPLGRRLKTVKIGAAAGDFINVEVHEPPAVTIGPLALDAPRGVLAFDLTRFRESLDLEVHGIVGMDFLNRYIVRIDPDTGELRFFKTLPPDSGSAFNMAYDQQESPNLLMRIGDLPETPFMLDTGMLSFDSGSLGTYRFARLEQSRILNIVGHATADSASGTRSTRIGRAKRLTLGEFEVADPVFGESGDDKVGLHFLSRFVATIDFPREKLYLKKGRRYAEPDLWNLSGLSIIRKDGRVVIDSVREESAAAGVGLKSRMSIEKVDDQATDKLSLDEIRRCFFHPGTLSLSVVEGEKKMDVRLELKR